MMLGSCDSIRYMSTDSSGLPGGWRGRGLASSNSRHSIFWTGSRPSCRHRASTGTGITGFSPRITTSDEPSRHMTTGNVGKRSDAATGGHAVGGHAAGEDATSDCCDSCDKLRPHDDRPGRYQPGLTRNSPSGQRWRKCYRPSSPLPAELIAEMVRLRWVIEMFFRMFK